MYAILQDFPYAEFGGRDATLVLRGRDATLVLPRCRARTVREIRLGKDPKQQKLKLDDARKYRTLDATVRAGGY